MVKGKSNIVFRRKLTELGKNIIPSSGRLWLYGSRARGNARVDSDWDLLILLDKEKPEFDDFKLYAYPFTLLGAEYNQEIVPQIYTKQQWESISFTPFYKNVELEKVELV